MVPKLEVVKVAKTSLSIVPEHQLGYLQKSITPNPAQDPNVKKLEISDF